MSEFIKSLTKQELNILKLVAQGFTNQEIADKLFVTKITVATHLCNLYQKAGMFRENVGASIMRLRLALLYKDYDTNNRYSKTLTEIKEMCKEEKGWVNCSDMKLTKTAQFAQQIFDKISEVEE